MPNLLIFHSKKRCKLLSNCGRPSRKERLSRKVESFSIKEGNCRNAYERIKLALSNFKGTTMMQFLLTTLNFIIALGHLVFITWSDSLEKHNLRIDSPLVFGSVADPPGVKPLLISGVPMSVYL